MQIGSRSLATPSPLELLVNSHWRGIDCPSAVRTILLSYGTDVNQSLLESINEFALDQLVTEPTRGRNILDLIFSSHPESISNIEVIPGISDHEAVYCELILHNKPESDNIEHPVFLYNRGNMAQLKADISDFQAT